MPIPEQYRWLEQEPAPQILLEALNLYGTKETPGPKSTPAIMQWAEELGAKRLGITYSDDSVAWCGLFVAICVKRAGLEIPFIPVRAVSWVMFGTSVSIPMLGDVLVFTRQGGGHVGIYVGEDAESYHVLGGNQSDCVCITRILKSRLTAARRTLFKGLQPINIRKVNLAKTGAISYNEA